MKVKEQRNLIQDIFPPQINRPFRQISAFAKTSADKRGRPAMRRSKDFFADFQTGFQCISILLIGLLIFTPLSSVFAEENAVIFEETSLIQEAASTTENVSSADIADVVSQSAEAMQDKALILPKADNAEEKIVSTTEGNLINVAEAGAITQDILDESAELIEAVIKEGIMGDSKIAENTDIITEPESEAVIASIEEILMPDTDVSSSSPEILEENTIESDISSSSPEIIEEPQSASTTDEVIIDDIDDTENNIKIIEEKIIENSATEVIIASPSFEVVSAPDPFAGRECIFLNDGNDFYCFKIGSKDSSSTNSETINKKSEKGQGRVFSIRDSDGDREIFFSINGTSTQVTNNNRDDLFPAQDISGSSVVWQSLINDRWQIMFYGQGMATTTQITDSDFNNMMPQIYGDVIVWQGWPQDNWEIFYAKKNNNDEWIVKQVTNNDYPDMFPKVMGNSITWQAFSSEGGSVSGSGGKDGGWHIFTYDIKSNAITKISAAGIKNENPKFMIVWEEKGNGTTIRAFGYDFSSGEVVELNNNEKPQEIPEPPLKDDAALSTSTSTPNKLENEESD